MTHPRIQALYQEALQLQADAKTLQHEMQNTNPDDTHTRIMQNEKYQLLKQHLVMIHDEIKTLTNAGIIPNDMSN